MKKNENNCTFCYRLWPTTRYYKLILMAYDKYDVGKYSILNKIHIHFHTIVILLQFSNKLILILIFLYKIKNYMINTASLLKSEIVTAQHIILFYNLYFLNGHYFECSVYVNSIFS